MIKKLDKFVLSRFMGPFILAYAVVTFIFLIQHLIRYFRHFVGKDLGPMVFAELFSYFALMLTPIALPLAVLLSALMSFGSLGEHSELTAIKSSGTSLLRILMPVGVFAVILTFGAVYFNDVISPEANLKAYSLLYDIKQKKPTLEFKEGAFYDGLPGYSIRVEGKSGEDGRELEGLMIYNHTAKQGNTDLIIAERGRMYSTHNGNYLVLEMINGKRYTDLSTERGRKHEEEFLENEFDSSKIVFDMESFGMKETKKELFKGHDMMKTARQLVEERDSVGVLKKEAIANLAPKAKAYYSYLFKEENEKIAKIAREQRNKATDKTNQNTPPKRNTTTGNKSDSVRDDRGVPSQKKSTLIRNKIDLSKPRNANELEKYYSRKGLPPFPNDEIEEEVEATKEEIEGVKAELSEEEQDSVQQALVQSKKSSGRKPLHTFPNMGKSKKNNQLTGSGRKSQEELRELRRKQVERSRPKPSNKKTVAPTPPKPSYIRDNMGYRVLNLAWSKANGIKISIEDVQRKKERHEKDMVNQWVELNNRYARSLAVFAMFLIGAPLGAIIKKGGLGVPILISILFFILYYITTITGTKLAKNQIVGVVIGCWGADILLLACGLFFLKQAYQDSRLLDFDYYTVAFGRLKEWIAKKRGEEQAS